MKYSFNNCIFEASWIHHSSGWLLTIWMGNNNWDSPEREKEISICHDKCTVCSKILKPHRDGEKVYYYSLLRGCFSGSDSIYLIVALSARKTRPYTYYSLLLRRLTYAAISLQFIMEIALVQSIYIAHITALIIVPAPGHDRSLPFEKSINKTSPEKLCYLLDPSHY